MQEERWKVEQALQCFPIFLVISLWNNANVLKIQSCTSQRVRIWLHLSSPLCKVSTMLLLHEMTVVKCRHKDGT